MKRIIYALYLLFGTALLAVVCWLRVDMGKNNLVFPSAQSAPLPQALQEEWQTSYDDVTWQSTTHFINHVDHHTIF